MTPNGSGMGVRKNFRLLKYEYIIYSFEARNLEIPLIQIQQQQGSFIILQILVNWDENLRLGSFVSSS